MARSKRNEIEELDEPLRLQEADTLEVPEERVYRMEEDDSDVLELGDTGRKGFARLNDEEMFRYRDF